MPQPGTDRCHDGRVTRLPQALVLAVAVLALAGCSDDAEPTASDPTSSPTSSSTSTATSTAPNPEPSTEPPSEPTSTPSASETVPTPPPSPTATVEPTTTPDPDAAPTTYDAALARFDALGQEPREVARFETPTGIYCVLDPAFVLGCELPAGGIPDPEYCGDGPSQNVGRVLFGDGDPVAECNSDTIREPGAKRLALDSVATAAGIQCLAEDIGVTCIDPERTQGFFLGRRQYAVFTAG